jgi:hypothetical protein
LSGTLPGKAFFIGEPFFVRPGGGETREDPATTRVVPRRAGVVTCWERRVITKGGFTESTEGVLEFRKLLSGNE